MPALTVDLTRPDARTGAAFPLRATVRVEVAPPLPDARLAAWVVDALEGAIAHGQRRYHLDRDEVPTRLQAVEDAAREPLATAVAAAGARVTAFEIVAIVGV